LEDKVGLSIMASFGKAKTNVLLVEPVDKRKGEEERIFEIISAENGLSEGE
jgi:hypothetical protein